MKLIDGNKEEDTDEKIAVFKTGVGLYSHGSEDFDVMINGEVAIWFKENGEVGFNECNLDDAGFKNPSKHTE